MCTSPSKEEIQTCCSRLGSPSPAKATCLFSHAFTKYDKAIQATLTTGKKHYLLLHETHRFWAKRFGLVILEAMVNIVLRFWIFICLTLSDKRSRRSAGKPEAMQSSPFTEMTLYALLWLKYGKYSYWIYQKAESQATKVMILETYRKLCYWVTAHSPTTFV